MKAKHIASLSALLAGLVFGALVERSNPAFSKMSMAGIVAALKAPLTLFAERSPGGRGAGALLSTKPNRRTAGTPHERVLAGVRDREAPLDVPSADIAPVGFGSTGAAPDEFAAANAIPGAQSQNSGFGPFPFMPFPIGYVGGQTFGSPPATGPAGGGGLPPGQTEGSPPGTPSLPSTPVTIPIPEPPTWTLMLLGILAFGFAVHWRLRNQAGPADLA